MRWQKSTLRISRTEVAGMDARWHGEGCAGGSPAHALGPSRTATLLGALDQGGVPTDTVAPIVIQ